MQQLRYVLIVFILSAFSVGCGGDDASGVEENATDAFSFRKADTPTLEDAVHGGKADSVTGSNPVLYIVPDGEWHSINYVNEYALNMLASDPASVSLDALDVGTGSILISDVNGPVKITMVAGDIYREEGLTQEDMPRWILEHYYTDFLNDLAYSYAYTLPFDRRKRTYLPEEDVVYGGDVLGVKEGYNCVEFYDYKEARQALEISWEFYNLSDSVKIKVEPIDWSLSEDGPDVDGGFEDLAEKQFERSSELLVKLTTSNVILEDAIARINAEIKVLEGELYQKELRVNDLVRSLDKREKELEAERERQRRNNLIACMFGYCQIAAVSELMRDDTRYNQIKKDLEQARQDQATVAKEVQVYHERRRQLEAERVDIQWNINSLRDKMSDVPEVAEFTGPSAVVRVAHHVSLARDLNEQLKASYQVSLEIHELLRTMNLTLDDFIAHLEKLDAYIEEYIEVSREEYFQMLRMTLDPNFDLNIWLDNYMAQQIESLLPKLPDVNEEYDKILSGFVDSMVRDYFDDPNSELAQKWRNEVYLNLMWW